MIYEVYYKGALKKQYPRLKRKKRVYFFRCQTLYQAIIEKLIDVICSATSYTLLKCGF